MMVLLLLLSFAQQSASQQSRVDENTAISVTTFGAKADGTTDSTAAIQRAIDEVSARPTRGRVFLPSGNGCYRVTSPLTIRQPGVRIEGENYALHGAGTCIEAQGFSGPMIHATAPSTQDLPLGPSLVSGPGRALITSPATQDTATFIDLQDAPAARLDGLNAFTAELFFRLTANNPNHPTLWASSGSLNGSDPTHSAFAFDLDDSLHLTGRLRVGPTTYAIAATTALSLGQTYHAAISYDGNNIRLFVGIPGEMSTLVGVRAAAGAISQGPYELMPVGGRHGSWPFGGRYADVPAGLLDSLRLSREARYVQPYRVPQRKHEFDRATLLLENFDRESVDFSVVQTSFGPTYLSKNPPLPGLLGYLEISHLQLHVGAGIGLWLHGVIMSNIHHVGISGGVFGISGREANFLNTFANLHLDSETTTYAKAGIALTTNAGITAIRDSSFTAWPTAIAMTNSGGGEFSNLFVHGQRQVIPFVIHLSSVHLNAIHTSNEDADDAYVATMRLTGNPNVAVTAGRFERYINAGPAIQVDGGASITFTAPWFQMNPKAKEVIQILSPASRPVLILNGESDPPVPWTTTAGGVMALP